MEVKHTPGPWAVNEDGWKVESEKEHGWINDGWIVCSTHGPDAEANALLIAAAPDLLEAAKEAYEWMNGLPIPTTGCTAKMQVLYNAIAKAGEAK